MKIRSFLSLFGLFFLLSVPAYADVAVTTETKVYFQNHGAPILEEVDYTVTCDGYEDYFWDEAASQDTEIGQVYSYTASCPNYGCKIYEGYYLNYKIIDSCDVEGTYGDESFKIENFANEPIVDCESARQFDESSGGKYYNYTDEYHACLEEKDYEDWDQCDQYKTLIPKEDIKVDDNGNPLEMACAITFDVGKKSLVNFFSDVSLTDENYDAIKYVKDFGFVDGYEDGTYKSDNKINRAEFVKILVNATTILNLGILEVCNNENPFSDIPSDVWYTNYVCYAKNQRIVDGYSDGTFKPAANINFVEAVKVISNAYDQLEVMGLDTATVWYQPYLDSLNSLIAFPASITDNAQYITRGEMAELIYRIENALNDSE